MKTKHWVIGIALLALVCGFLTFWLFGGDQNANSIEIWSEGERIYTFSLHENHTIVIEGDTGTNTVRIQDGKVAVIDADCPDKHCIQRGYCAGGAQIVCLPNELIIKFLGTQSVDGTVG